MNTRLRRGAALLILVLGPSFVVPAQAATPSATATGTLRLPSDVLDRSGTVAVVYELKQGFTGRAQFNLRWTDSLGRTIVDRTDTADLVDETQFVMTIDAARAVAMKNHLRVNLLLKGQDVDGQAYVRHEVADADFIARPPDTDWRDYRVMMWQHFPAAQWPMLKTLGVIGGQDTGRSGHLPRGLIATNTRWYSGRLAPEFYSPYHRWRRDRSINWSFDQAKALYQEHSGSQAAFKRHPSLQDPYWRALVQQRAAAVAQRNAPYRPYFYSLSDEPGIAELEAQWDFDFSDQSLVPMRRWLQSQYASLGALNQEWGTQFTDWNRVMPMTTNQAMAQRDNNFAAWADFKTWMDISFANALKMGADAVREGDPGAFVGVTGAQKPGWGGYDYTRLTKALTAIEPYDIGRSVDIVASLAPNMPIVTTSFAGGRREQHRVWHELLHGNRGIIVWDANHDFVQADGQPGKRGLRAGRYLNEIENGVGALLINSRVENHRIAIHYSQPSLRTQWLLERRRAGDKWMERSASYERTHNQFMRLRESWCDLIADLGMQYDFVGYDQIPEGELLKRGYQVLVLPQSSSLSAAEARAIRAFVADGGIAIASGVPGTYDEHSRKLARASLADLFGDETSDKTISARAIGRGKAILLNADIESYLEDRLKDTAEPKHQLIEQLLRANGVRPDIAVENQAGHSVVGVERRVFDNAGVRLISLQTNPQLRVDELGPPDFQSNQRFYQARTVRLRLPRAMHVYDVRAGRALGQKQGLKATVDAFEPTILAVSDAPLAPMRVTVADTAKRGTTLRLAVHARPTAARINVFHVEVRDPRGQRVGYYTRNLISRDGGGALAIPLAVDDRPGKWHITVRDLLSGQTVSRSLTVE